MRRVLLVLTMVAGIALIAWSGWHNWNERKIATARHIELIPDTSKAQSAETDDASDGQSQLKGKAAPAFNLLDLSGKKVSLHDFKGHPLLINFWGTYCAPCKIEMPWLQEFSKKYAADGLEVIGITYDSEVGKEKIERDTQKLGVTYPILLSDKESETAYLSNTEVLPMSFYVDRGGKVIEVTAGQGSKDQLEAKVKEVIAAGER